MIYETSKTALLAGLLLSLVACSGSSGSVNSPAETGSGDTDQTEPEDQTVPIDQTEPEDQTVPIDQTVPVDQTEPEDQDPPAAESPTPLPRVTLTSAAASITSGYSTTLDWTSTNVDSCQASGGWSGSRTPAGSEFTPALTQDTTFSLTCSNVDGSAMAMVAVSVTAQLSLRWKAPTENVDGTPLSEIPGS
jgi:hypothetical protein